MTIFTHLKVMTKSDCTLFEHGRLKYQENKVQAIYFRKAWMDLFPDSELIYYSYSWLVEFQISGWSPMGDFPVYRDIRKFGRISDEWRLHGGRIRNPHEQDNRFNFIDPGSLCLITMEGDNLPQKISLEFLHPESEYHKQIKESGISLFSNTNGNLQSCVDKVYIRNKKPTRQIDDGWFEQRRKTSEDNGKLGELVFAEYLKDLIDNNILEKAEHSSIDNQISPFDFLLTYIPDCAPVGYLREYIDVKSTNSSFRERFYMSVYELKFAAESIYPYRIARVSYLNSNEVTLHMSGDIRDYAKFVVENHLMPMAQKVGCFPDRMAFGPNETHWNWQTEILIPGHTTDKPVRRKIPDKVRLFIPTEVVSSTIPLIAVPKPCQMSLL